MLRRRSNRKRAPMRKRRAYRKRARTANPVFTEMLEASAVTTGSGGIFSCKFTDLPQNSAYSVLYKQFCIKKLQVILLPNFGEVDPALLASGQNTTRFSFAVDDTPNLLPPVSEIDVLASNGAKVVMGTKKIVINCRPKPSIQSTFGKFGSTNVATRVRGNVWLNTDSAQVSGSGTGVDHFGIRWWSSTGPIAINTAQYSVYYKITVALRDAA